MLQHIGDGECSRDCVVSLGSAKEKERVLN